MSGRALSRRLRISNRRGLHARAAAKFVTAARGFDADVRVRCDGQSVPAGSIMGLLMLAAAHGKEIELSASGKEAHEALDALAQLVTRGFDERDPATKPT
ncbi:MAG: HPr family phosphocarrier protein [Hyphomicrobiales bacterium]|nr:HPr family phosphocarrier protein [Hyphomicrobiales bacterium]